MSSALISLLYIYPQTCVMCKFYSMPFPKLMYLFQNYHLYACSCLILTFGIPTYMFLPKKIPKRFLNAFSCAQIGQSSFNANAKYSTSFKCGANSLASSALSKNCSRGMKLTLNLTIPTKASKSRRENPDLPLINKTCAKRKKKALPSNLLEKG